MICITGLDRKIPDLMNRFMHCWAFPLHEVRLDALEEPMPPVSTLPIPPAKLIVTCRRPSDGGLFEGPEEDRLRLLASAIEMKPRWIDLEADLPENAAEPLLRRAKTLGVPILRSLHLLRDNGAGSILKALARLSKAKGQAIKLAARVEDVEHLEEFLDAPRDRPAVFIGMGPAGVISRALHRRFGSAWTYVSLIPWPDPKAGIPDLETACLWNMPVDGETRLFVLLGGPAISASPGPRVYNRLFREKRFKGIYLPAITGHPEAAFRLLDRLGLKGASVTIPHKIQAAGLAHELSDPAREAGSVNTLYRTPSGRWRGENTDVSAVRNLTSRLTALPLRRGAVLGTGGFARAAALALDQCGLEVTLYGRTLPEESGPWVAARSLDAIEDAEFDLLVNATPLGLEKNEDPLAGFDVDLKGKVVLDAVLSPSPTTLMVRAAGQGAAVAGGMEIWAEQGARQLDFFGGPRVTAGELSRRIASSSDPPSAPLPP